MNRFFSCLILMLSLVACKSKKAKRDVPVADFFPVIDYLKGQVAMMDTSHYSFKKIETTNGKSDTVAIKNTEIKNLAKDFLSLPDITASDVKDDYDINHLYDEDLNAFAFTFTTKEDHPVKSEHVVLDPQPNAQGKNDIQSIFVDLWQNNSDVSVRKGLLWEANKSFQITTTTDAPGKPQEVKRLKVLWNNFDTQNK